MILGTPTRPSSTAAILHRAWPLICLIAGVALSSSHPSTCHWLGVSLIALAALGLGARWPLRGQGLSPASRPTDGDALWHAWQQGCEDAVMVLAQRSDPMGRFMGYEVVSANARAQALFQPAGSVAGQPLTDVLPAGLPESFHERLSSAWRSGCTQVDEHALMGRAGAPARWYSHQMIPLADRLILVSRDTSEAHQTLAALREQEAFYRSLVDSLPMAVFARSARPHNAGEYVVWNRMTAEIMNLPAEQALGQHPHDILSPDMARRSVAIDEDIARTPRVAQFPSLAYQTPTGERLVDLTKAPIYGVDGQLDHILSIAVDITSQRQAADQLRLASRVIEETGDAIVVSDALDRVVMVNPAFLRMSGLDSEDIVGRDAELLGLAPLREAYLPGLAARLALGERWTGESPLAGPDGRLLETWLSISALRNEAQQVTQHIRVFSDISTLKAQQRELSELARRDSLTGLPNRRVFGERLRQAMSRAQRHPQTLAVMYVDLDGFKAINDRLGHAAGDRLLNEVARRLEASVRTTDCVCRLSGDEFTVILENAGHPEEVTLIAQRILARLAQPCQLGADTVFARASIGAAVCQPGDDMDALCQRADAAMYGAKHAGKGRFVLAWPGDATAPLPQTGTC